MADLTQFPHSEDLIFNKPSLKEFIRLIKNGTIHEIWPSSQEEFNWWNGVGNYSGQTPGYKSYINEEKGLTEDKLKLKHVNTSVTIFYGDHEDSTTSSDLDLNRTQTNFNILKTKIENNNGFLPLSEQEKIVADNYFDSLSDLGYPKLTLNTSTGAINKNEITNYQSIAKAKFEQNKYRWDEIIQLIRNFQPSGITKTYIIDDHSALTEKYRNYFDNNKNGININSHISDLGQIDYNLKNIEIDYNITDLKNNYFYFENILNVISDYKNKIEIKNSNGDYIGGVNSILLSINEPIITTTDLEEKAQLVVDKAQQFYNYLYGKINSDGYSGLIEQFEILKTYILNDHANLFSYITDYNIAPIEANNQTFNDLINIIEFYKNLYENLLILKRKGGSVLASDLTEYIQAINGITQKNELITESNTSEILNEQIAIVNNYINAINSIITELRTGSYQNDIQSIIQNYTIPNLKYSYVPANIYNLVGNSGVLGNINTFYNIIMAEMVIHETYNIGNGMNLKLTSQGYQEYLSTINSIVEDFLLGTEEERQEESFVSPLQQAQTDIMILLEDFLKEYLKCLQQLSEKGFTCITPKYDTFTVDTQTEKLAHQQDILNDLKDQYNKSYNYFSIILTIVPDKDTAALQKLTNDYNDLLNKITNIKINIMQAGDSQFFNDWITQNFNKIEIANLIKHLTNIVLDTDDPNIDKYIPIPSDDYLTISNQTDILNEYNNISKEYNDSDRLGKLEKILYEITSQVSIWVPFWNSTDIKHYICMNVGSFIEFANESTIAPYDGSISITVDGIAHYPLVNGLVDSISSSTTNTKIPTIAGLKSIFGDNFDKIGSKTAGTSYKPLYLNNGVFTEASNVIAGTYGKLKDNNSVGWQVTDTSGSIVSIQATKVFGAVYNDYAEYRNAIAQPGQCVIENGDGSLSPSTGRLQLGANIVSDTYGFAIGETNDATCPIAVSGRVLALPLEDIAQYTPGAAVCSGPNGTISLMTREEIREWPDAIVGFVSEVPTYDTWGSDNVPVNGRIWIKIK